MEAQKPEIYGMLAEFTTPTEIVAAANKAREAGFSKMEAYSPFPVEDLYEAVGFKRTKLPILVFFGGLAGFFTAFSLQTFTMGGAPSFLNPFLPDWFYYPLNIGGRPLNSWPAFVPPEFELAVLFSAFTAVFGMLLLNGYPRLYHPLFNVPRFSGVTTDRFFLCIEARDPLFDIQGTRHFLEGLKPFEVSEVPQ
ncbi:MAG: DUF3341 domain-containing protein [Gemmataceae bacterium]|nr:DUF3341 domain-containing protein [Gemmataceae bacterium]